MKLHAKTANMVEAHAGEFHYASSIGPKDLFCERRVQSAQRTVFLDVSS
jgi:hypothetical protein